MCLIIMSPSGGNKKSEFLKNVIIEASELNSDGAGFAIKKADTGQVIFSKGYFVINTLLEDIENLDVQDNDELVVHVRIGNRGEVNTELCHPFFIDKEEENILKLQDDDVKGSIMFHNGTFFGMGTTNSKHSDTFHFIQDILSEEGVMDLVKINPLIFEIIADRIISPSRVLIMSNDANTIKFGKWYEEEGILFSKDIRNSEKYKTPSNTYPEGAKTYVHTSRKVSSNIYRRNSYDDREAMYGNLFGYDIDDEVGKLRESKNQVKKEEKEVITIIGDNLAIPKTDGFLRGSSQLIKLPEALKKSASFLYLRDTLYISYGGLLIPRENDDPKDYLLEINNITKNYITVICKDESYAGEGQKGKQYWITEVDEERERVILVDSEGDRAMRVSLIQLYNRFIIYANQDHRYLIKELTILNNLIPKNYYNQNRLTTMFKKSIIDGTKYVKYSSTFKMSTSACMLYINIIKNKIKENVIESSIIEDTTKLLN